MAIQTTHVAHSSRPQLLDVDLCPWCEQPIAHSKFVEIQERLATEERKKLAKLEKQHIEDLEQQRLKIESQVRTAERKVTKEQIAEHERQRKAAVRATESLRKGQDSLIAAARREERLTYDKAVKDALGKEKARADDQLRRMSRQVETLQRQLAAQRAAGSGEGADLDLVEELKRAFPKDRFKPLNGEGANLSHEILDKGRPCGTVVYDTRKHEAWRNGYAIRIRKDQLAAKADVAIIASLALPAGAHQVHIADQVLVVSPARLITIAEIFRRHLVLVSALRLTLEDRATKSLRLYEFIASDGFAQLLTEIESGANAMTQVDVDEKSAHDLVWEKRGRLIQGMVQAHGRIEARIRQIVNVSGTES